jgi:hypothetical protein
MSWFSDWWHGGNNGAQNAANQQIQMMEAQQAKHDAAVSQGKQSIDQAFQQFTPDYFSGYTKSYMDAYNPQLTNQYNQAKQKMIATLAGNDQLEGSTGAYSLGNLDKTYGTAQADIANRAQDATNSFRSTVNNSKNQLYGLNAAAADPLTMATQAQSTAGALVSPQSYPTMANVFGDALGSVATGASAYVNRGPYAGYGGYPYGGYGPTLTAPIGGGGSAMVMP